MLPTVSREHFAVVFLLAARCSIQHIPHLGQTFCAVAGPSETKVQGSNAISNRLLEADHSPSDPHLCECDPLETAAQTSPDVDRQARQRCVSVQLHEEECNAFEATRLEAAVRAISRCWLFEAHRHGATRETSFSKDNPVRCATQTLQHS